MEFYRLMCADACSLCLRTIHKPVSPSCAPVYMYIHDTLCVCPLKETRIRLNLEMLGLLYRLNERDNEWENVIPPELVHTLSFSLLLVQLTCSSSPCVVCSSGDITS